MDHNDLNKRIPAQGFLEIFIPICQYLVAGLFIFSGFVKAVDPLGTAYKMEDYFEIWSAENFGLFKMMAKLLPYALPLAVIMVVAELALGFALLMGYMRKLTVFVLLLLILFFTVLTGYTFKTGEPAVCGCFGDFLVISSKASFLKDVFLSTLIVILIAFNRFIKEPTRRNYGFWITSVVVIFLCFIWIPMSLGKSSGLPYFGYYLGKAKTWYLWAGLIIAAVLALRIARMKHDGIMKQKLMHIAVWGFTLISLLFSFSNYLWGLPLYDYRPFKPGADINELTYIIEPEFAYFFLETETAATIDTSEYMDYAFDIPTEEFSTYWSDTTYTYAGYNQKTFPDNSEAESFMLGSDAAGTDSFLLDPGYNLLLLIHDVHKVKDDYLKEKIVPIAEEAMEDGTGFVMAAYYYPEDSARLAALKLPFDYYTFDEIIAKRMIRANPGLFLLKEGVVVDKWHKCWIPSYSKIRSKYISK